MASQIAHIVYGQLVIDKYLINTNIARRDFYIGTLFPNIRHRID